MDRISFKIQSFQSFFSTKWDASLCVILCLMLFQLSVQAQGISSVSGMVYKDTDGIIDNQVDGSGVTGFSDFKIIAVDKTSNMVSAVTAVSSADGSYSITSLLNGTYKLVLVFTTNPPAVGDDASGLTSSLPNQWEHIGEFWGAGQGSDGIPDGVLEVMANGVVSNANFGIRVGSPCSLPVQGNTFSWNYTSEPNGSTVSQTITQPASNGGFVFDIYALDNSFNMSINGTDLAVDELQFQSSGTPGPINIEFADGDQYETDTQGDIWQMAGTQQHPLIRVKISAAGAISLYGSKTSGGPLFPLVLTQGNSFNTMPWNSTSANNIIVTQVVTGTTSIDGYGYGLNIVDCNPVYTISKDGVFNDENSDGYAEAGETITYTFKVKNIGTNAAYNIVVNDPQLGGEITASPSGDTNNDGALDAGANRETWTYTVSYTVTAQDIANGGIYNQANVTGGNGVGNRFDPVLSKDPTPLLPGDGHYDSTRPNHTFVFLKSIIPVRTNPQLLNPVSGN